MATQQLRFNFQGIFRSRGLPIDRLITLFNEENILLGYAAYELMKQPDFTKAQTERWMPLVEISVGALRLTSNPTYSEICKKALGQKSYFQGDDCGIELSGPDCAPEYRLSNKLQPFNQRLFTAMKPINNPNNKPMIFQLKNGVEGLELNAHAVDDIVFQGTDTFIFELAVPEFVG